MTRQNTTIIQKRNGAFTHIRTAGFKVDNDTINEIKKKLREHIKRQDIIIFSGSLPPGAIDDVYLDLVELSKESGAFVVLDTSGAPLVNALTSKPDMIKPNLSEFQSTFGLPSDNNERIVIDQMFNLLKSGISHIAVTLGYGGVLVLTEKEPVILKGSIALGEEYVSRKAVGSGDAMLAGFIYSIKNDFNNEEMIRLGVACGAANVLPHPPGQIEYDHIQQLKKRVQIERVTF
jgi:1-phosphofructokinase